MILEWVNPRYPNGPAFISRDDGTDTYMAACYKESEKERNKKMDRGECYDYPVTLGPRSIISAEWDTDEPTIVDRYFVCPSSHYDLKGRPEEILEKIGEHEASFRYGITVLTKDQVECAVKTFTTYRNWYDPIAKEWRAIE